MRSALFALGSFLTVSLVGPRVARADEPLRLEDAVKTALANNERAKKAPLRVVQAEGALDRARDAFFPSLTAGGSANIRPTDDRNTRAVTEAGTLTLNQPLFTPSAFPNYWQQSHNYESEKYGALEDKRTLAFDTAKAFVQALTADQVLKSAQHRLETTKTNLDTTKARAEAGLTSTNDVTRAELDLATSSQQVATSQGTLEQRMINLGFLMGKRVQGPLAAPDRTTTAAQRVAGTRADAIKAAIDRRPDVRSQHEKVEATRESSKEPLWRLAPSLGAQGQMRFNPDPGTGEKGVDESLSLTLTWTIFDSGVRYADRKTRLAQLESASLDEQLLKRSVETDLALAVAALRAARESYRLADSAVSSAAKNVEETGILYKQGLSNALQLTDASSKQFDAEVTRANAKLTMEQSYLDLRKALGYGPTDEEIK